MSVCVQTDAVDLTDPVLGGREAATAAAKDLVGGLAGVCATTSFLASEKEMPLRVLTSRIFLSLAQAGQSRELDSWSPLQFTHFGSILQESLA